MSDVKLNLSALSLPDKIGLAGAIAVDMTGNPAFLSPTPTLLVVTAAADALSEKSQAARSARLAAVTATSEQDAAEAALDGVLTQLASYVQTVSNGDADIIRSAGMQVRAERTKPQPLDAPVIKSAEVGVQRGSVDLAWLPLDSAKSFAVEHTPDLTGQTGWTNGVDLTRRSGTVPNLTPGGRYLFRVAGVNSLGKGPWSQTVEQLAAL
jgi:hypothetical protein